MYLQIIGSLYFRKQTRFRKIILISNNDWKRDVLFQGIIQSGRTIELTKPITEYRLIQIVAGPLQEPTVGRIIYTINNDKNMFYNNVAYYKYGGVYKAMILMNIALTLNLGTEKTYYVERCVQCNIESSDAISIMPDEQINIRIDGIGWK